MALFAMLILMFSALAAAAAAALSWRVARGRDAGVRVGVDIVEVAVVEAALSSARRQHYLDLVYTHSEQSDCIRQDGIDASRLAARFAAKEAVWKALGEEAMTLPWRSVEVVRAPGGRPLVRLHGGALAAAERLGLRGFALSLTHEPEYAAAVVVATR